MSMCRVCHGPIGGDIHRISCELPRAEALAERVDSKRKVMAKHPPQEPQRATAGRFAPPLWLYDGKVYGYWEAAARYEADRADFLAEQAGKMELQTDEPIIVSQEKLSDG